MGLGLVAPLPSSAPTILSNTQYQEAVVEEQLDKDQRVHELLVEAKVEEVCRHDVLVPFLLVNQQDPACPHNPLYLACLLEKAWSSAQQENSCAKLSPMTLLSCRLSQVAGLGLV